MGSWIGGDRDGNPFVTASVLRQAMGMQSKRVFEFYLDELHLLGGELSLNRARVSISAQLEELVRSSPDASSPRRASEPYRQAIVGIYSRLVTTARGLGHDVLPRHAVADASPYASAGELRADLDILHRSLFTNGSAMIARSRLRKLRRAIDVFGFHLAGVDLRQNSDVHERVLAELFRAGSGADYAGMSEQSRTALLLAELATARPLISPFVTYSEETTGEIDILRTLSRIADKAITDAYHSVTAGASEMDIAAALTRAEQLGGTIVQPVQSVPGTSFGGTSPKPVRRARNVVSPSLSARTVKAIGAANIPMKIAARINLCLRFMFMFPSLV